MKKKLVIAALLILSSWAPGQPTEEMLAKLAANRSVYLLDAAQKDGTRLKYETTAEVANKTPVWSGAGEPPLAGAKAVSRAEETLKKKYPGFVQFEIFDISLTRIMTWGIKNRWYYQLTFHAMTEVDGIRTTTVTVVMLLDGSIVEPRVATE